MLIKPKLGQEKLGGIWSNTTLGTEREEMRGVERTEEEKRSEEKREKRSLMLNRV